MQPAAGRLIAGLSLTQRFAIVSLAILLTGMMTIGWWVTRQIEEGVLARTAAVTASFVSSAVAPHLVELSEGPAISPEQMAALDRLLLETELGERIVSFKVWSPAGEILYSPNREIVGRAFGTRAHLRAALEGETVSHVSDLSDPENEFERERFTKLQETYIPLRALGSGEITGAVEFYESTDALEAELGSARRRSWLFVAGATVVMYALLVGMVGGASLTISRQRRELARIEAQNELDRIKVEFISGISHEIRTPLGLVRGYATTLRRDDVEIDSETSREFLQIIDDESGKLQRMIDDLLDASRLEAGTLTMNPAPTGLRAMLSGALQRAQPALSESGHSVVEAPAAEDVAVLADPERIEQVVYNLLDNAARYSSPGTVIRVESRASGDEVVVAVEDRGPGIPEGDLERIFEPFFRGDTPSGRRDRGTGLGLAVSKAIVEAHGGRIWAESAPGVGSVVRFTLPRASGTQDGSAPAAADAGDVI